MMAKNYSRVLLVTANVGSIFEEPEKMIPIWMQEFIAIVTKLEPEFLAIHCQEVGGKNYEETMQHVNKFIKMLLSLEEMQQFNRARVFLDEDFTAVEKFTALGSLYFIHSSISSVEIFDFQDAKFVPVEGKEVLSGNIEHVRIKEKAKFAQEFYPDFVWSRKGFIRTRWNLYGTMFDLVNIHLIHDVNNIAAMETSPSTYSGFRVRALLHTIERFEKDQYEKVPFFMFGDYNFRLDTHHLVKKLTESAVEQRVAGKKNDISKVIYKTPDSDKLREYDTEPEVCRSKLFEYQVTFPPSYPFSEDADDGTSYMPTRCPGWCDRIMMSHDASSLFHADNGFTSEYKMIGMHICMGDHKPIYLNLQLRHKTSAASGNNDGRLDCTSDQAVNDSPTRRHAPIRKVVSINGEEVDVESANIHDYTTFEKEELLGSAFIDGIKRKTTGEGGPPPRRLVSFRNTVKSIIHTEAVMRALKHYSHRSDSEQSEDDEQETTAHVEHLADGRETESIAHTEQVTDGRESITVSNNDSAFSSTLVSPSSDSGATDTICGNEVINPVAVSAASEACVSDEIVADLVSADPDVDIAVNNAQFCLNFPSQESSGNEPYFSGSPLLKNPTDGEDVSSSLLEEVPLLVENKSCSETTVSVEQPGVEHEKSLLETSVSVEPPCVEHDKSRSETTVPVEQADVEYGKSPSETTVSVEQPGVEHEKSPSETIVSVEQSGVEHKKSHSETSVSLESYNVNLIEPHSVSIGESVGSIESPSTNGIVSDLSNAVEPSNLEQNRSQGETSVLVECGNQQPTKPETEMGYENEQIPNDFRQESTMCENPKGKPAESFSVVPETPSNAAIVCMSASVPHTTDVEQLGLDVVSLEVVGKEQSADPPPVPDSQYVDQTFDSSLVTTKPSIDNHDHKLPAAPSCTVVSPSQGFVNGSVGKLDAASHIPDAEGDNSLAVESDCDKLLSCKAPNESAAAVIDGELDRISTDDDGDRTDRPTDSLLPNAAENESPKNHRVSSDDADCQCCCVQ